MADTSVTPEATSITFDALGDPRRRFVKERPIGNHGGRVEVVSREGEGSTFTVVLPLVGGHGTEARAG